MKQERPPLPPEIRQAVLARAGDRCEAHRRRGEDPDLLTMTPAEEEEWQLREAAEQCADAYFEAVASAPDEGRELLVLAFVTAMGQAAARERESCADQAWHEASKISAAIREVRP